MKTIEKKESLNSNLRIFAEQKHPVLEVTPKELIELLNNADDRTIFNVTVDMGGGK